MLLDIKDIITLVTVESGVTLVTVYNLPNNTECVSTLFSCLAEEGVNVDMISLNPSSSLNQTVSFSALDGDLSKILTTVGKIKNAYPEVRTDINSRNCKTTFVGEGMRERCGVAAHVFSVFSEKNIHIKLITTSETKISCLSDEADYDKLESVLGEFGMKL